MSGYPLSEHRASWAKLTKEPEVCTCTPVNPRHTEPHRCVTAEQLAAWAERSPGAVIVQREETRLFLCWLWLSFSQDPEARRLSGRTVTLAESDRLRAHS